MLDEGVIRKYGLFDSTIVGQLLKKVRNRVQVSEVDGMALVGILSSQLLYHQFIERAPDVKCATNAPNKVIDRRSVESDRR